MFKGMEDELASLIVNQTTDNQMFRKMYTEMINSGTQFKDKAELVNKITSIANTGVAGVAGAGVGAASASVLAGVHGTTEVVEDGLKIGLPIVGSVMAAAISGGTMYITLSNSLNIYKKMSKSCLDIMKSYHGLNK